MQINDELKSSFEHSSTGFNTFMTLSGEVYRQVKNRTTLRTLLNGRAYFVKQHKGIGSKELLKHIVQCRLPVFSARQEWQAIQAVSRLNISTTPLVAYGETKAKPTRRRSFIVTRAIEHAISLEDYFPILNKQPDKTYIKQTLIVKLAKLLRTLHENGINHRDCYLCHFLINPEAPDTLYLIDLHRAQIRPKVPLRARIKDLAALYFSAMDLDLTQRDILRFLKHYGIARKRYMLTWIARRALALYRKVHQQEPKSVVHFPHSALYQRWRIQWHRDTPRLRSILDFITTATQNRQYHTSLLKYDTKTLVYRLEDSVGSIVIKSFLQKHWLKRLWRNRASRCWRFSHQLIKHGIHTPYPLMTVSRHLGPFITRAYFIYAYQPGLNSHDFFHSPTIDKAHKQEAATHILELFKQLKSLHLTHGDFKPTNVILVGTQPWLIDLDAMRYRLNNTRDEKRFMRDWPVEIRRYFDKVSEK